MKRIMLLLGASFIIGVFGTQAQEAPISQPSSVASNGAAGNIACFDYYHFGSVQADLTPNLTQTVPGAVLLFSGQIVNENDYPLVDGKLFVKIFKRDDATFAVGDGNPVVDQFTIAENISLPANGTKEASFEWRVPSNAAGGEYYAAYFFTTSDRYNLMGLSFTDDVVGNQAAFSVVSQENVPVVQLQKQNTTLNGQNHHFAANPRHFKADETVVIKTTLNNPSNTTKTVPLQWNQYAWDAQSEENRRSTKTELVTLAPNETKEVSHEVKPQKEAIVYMVVVAQDGGSKSFLNIRYVRDGIPETRINFPSLSQFPLKAGEPNRLFACAHSTNEALVPGNTLILTLKDQANNPIYQYRYEGDISGAMGGFGEEFLPQENYNNVTLQAQLYRDGSEVENVSIQYDCNEIDPQTCLNEEKVSQKGFFGRNPLWYLGGGMVAIVLIGGILMYLKRKPKPINW